jgi:hypothetical protein
VKGEGASREASGRLTDVRGCGWAKSGRRRPRGQSGLLPTAEAASAKAGAEPSRRIASGTSCEPAKIDGVLAEAAKRTALFMRKWTGEQQRCAYVCHASSRPRHRARHIDGRSPHCLTCRRPWSYQVSGDQCAHWSCTQACVMAETRTSSRRPSPRLRRPDGCPRPAASSASALPSSSN